MGRLSLVERARDVQLPSDYERLLLSNALLGHHLPAGYCDLLLELSGAYTSEGASDALAALRARVIASDWARPVDRSVLT